MTYSGARKCKWHRWHRHSRSWGKKPTFTARLQVKKIQPTGIRIDAWCTGWLLFSMLFCPQTTGVGQSWDWHLWATGVHAVTLPCPALLLLLHCLLASGMVNAPVDCYFPFHLVLIPPVLVSHLKAKLEAAIANLQSSVDTLEKKFEQKLNQQIESLKMNQVDKTTQETHSRDLEALTKSVGFLIDQVALIADKLRIPMPQSGVGHS